jgi:hypothetical protein
MNKTETVPNTWDCSLILTKTTTDIDNHRITLDFEWRESKAAPDYAIVSKAVLKDIVYTWREHEFITVGTFSGLVVWEDSETLIFKRVSNDE